MTALQIEKKFAGIVFSELFKGNPPTIYLKPAKLPTVLVLNLYVNAFVHIVGIALILLITYHKNSFITQFRSKSSGQPQCVSPVWYGISS